MSNTGLFIAICCCLASGCVAPPSATNRERAQALAEHQRELVADRTIILHGVYYLLSISDDFQSIAMDPATGNIQAHFSGTKRFSQALAVAIDRRGYFLTSGHTLSAYNYVIGEFAGGLSIKKTRVVCRFDHSDKCDLAILKTEEALMYPLRFASDPKSGDLVFAVVFDKNEQTLGGTRKFSAGVIRGIEPCVHGNLIDSTVPLREGDSGGPMLTPDGLLVGITQGWNYVGNGITGKYTKLSARPEWDINEEAIEADLRTH